MEPSRFPGVSMTTTLSMNGTRPLVVHDGKTHLVAVQDTKVRYWIDGVEFPPPVATARSVALAECDGCVAGVYATGKEIRFVASDGRGTWNPASDTLLWTGAGEQPSLRVTPDSVTAAWHADIAGAAKDADGTVYVARVEGSGGWSVVEVGPGKFPSLAVDADVIAFRTKRTGAWTIWTASFDGKGWPVTTLGVTGKDPSIAVDAGGAEWIAFQDASAIYLRPPYSSVVQVAPIGLYPSIALDGDDVIIGYERPASKGGSTDTATKRAGLAWIRGGVVTDITPADTGLGYTTVSPDGSRWAAVRQDGTVIVRAIL